MGTPTRVRNRTAAEMLANPRPQAAAPEGQEPIPQTKSKLEELLENPERVKALATAANTLYPETGDLGLIRLCLGDAGMAQPATSDPWEFVVGLLQSGWKREITCFAEPARGNIFVTVDERGDPLHLGMVDKPQTDKSDQVLRDYFVRVGEGDRKIEVGKVGFWLLCPTGCTPCSARKKLTEG